MELSTVLARVGSWVLLICITALGYNAWGLFVSLVLKPYRLKRFLEAQGLKGMPYRFFFGNIKEMVAIAQQTRSFPMPQISHDIAPRILPHYFVWARKLGKPFFFWFGSQPSVVVPEPELVREILSNKFGHYSKLGGRPDTKGLFGMGLGALQGEKWAQHRRILNPAFFIDKLKAMTPTMAACTSSVLNDWAAQIEKEASGRKEIDVHLYFSNLTGDIIAHTAFGSSYAEGKQVFQIQHEQQIILEKVIRRLYIPGSRFVPTPQNRHQWSLEKRIQELLRQLIYSRMDAVKLGRVESYGNDLLGLMMAANTKELEGNQKGLSMDIDETVDECKTFFFAGHETTSTLLTWTFLLLGTNIEWQEKAREEVLSMCGRGTPTPESLNSLKTVAMILYEALRLYPPVTQVARVANKDMRLGNDLVLPRGTSVMLPVIAIHHDPTYWGADADLFNPQRFAEGIANAASDPSAFMPFGMGPRICIGQNFAILEAKIVLASILQRFTFQISPTYTNAPTTVITLQPQFGMQIIFEMLLATH